MKFIIYLKNYTDSKSQKVKKVVLSLCLLFNDNFQIESSDQKDT